MAQNAKYRTWTLDEHYTAWYESDCGNCKYMIRGLGEYTCEKHPEKIPAKYWNNKNTCPDKKEISEHRPFRK